MTSKLIERLINKEYLTERERKEWLNAIKERLEALEKENVELQLQLEQLEDSAKIRMQQADKYATTLKEKYLDLIQENEKLKNENKENAEFYVKSRDALWDLKMENEKLKKIIKENFWVFNNDEVLFKFNEHTPIMQNELKEVLENE